MSDIVKIKAQIPTVNIEIPTGNARRFEISITSDGKPYDLSSFDLKMTFRPSVGGEFDGSENLTKDGQVLFLTFPPEFSAGVKWRRARYDILNASTHQTLIRGEIELLEVITK